MYIEKNAYLCTQFHDNSRMLLNDSAPVMRTNNSGSLLSSAIPSGSDPFLSKQLQEKMRQPLWYPMRVAYDKSDRVLQIHKHLDQKGIENFLPMKIVHDREDFNVKSRLVPAIPGLIFIHDTRIVITDLKHQSAFSAMRYWTDAVAPEDAEDRILTVPDRQMENFIRTVTANTDKVNYLEYNAAFFSKPGQAVRITDGEFAGCTGIIRRIKKRRCVVVEVNGICAVAITFVPSDWLELI